MLNNVDKKEIRLTITGLLTHACGMCPTPNLCEECPVKESMQMMNARLEGKTLRKLTIKKGRIPKELTVDVYKAYKKKDKKFNDDKICYIFGISREQLHEFKKKNDLIKDVLPDEIVKEIRRLHKEEGYTYRQLGEMYDRSHGSINDILNYRSYRHIEEEAN
ncbi:hypothetical protein AB3N02_13935 [Priestia aryabhattai]|uniref:hypothetical protein n=1 Tax=Priestia aryabhattai TaxID=412384 RepID=UPI0039A12CF4